MQVQALEQQLDGRCDERRLLRAVGRVERVHAHDSVAQPGDLAHRPHVVARRDQLAGFDHQALLKGVEDGLELVERRDPVERGEHRLGHEALDDPLLGRVLACRLDLDLARRRGEHRGARPGRRRRG